MRSLLLCSLLLTSLFGSAQDQTVKPSVQKKQKWEIGFNLYSITDREREVPIVTSKFVTQNNLFSGIFAKTHFNKNVLRVAFDYSKKVIDISNTSGYYWLRANGYKESCEYRVGYEREFHIKRFIPYLSADLSYQAIKEEGIESVYGDMVSYSNRNYLYKTNRYSVCFGTGLKFMVTKNICLSYEFNFQHGYSNRSHNIANGNPYKFESYFERVNPMRQFGLSMVF